MQDTLQAKGKLTIVLHDETGVVKEVRELDNVVVTAGLTHIASRMIDPPVSVMSHMEVGIGTAAAALGNTALGSAVASSRTALTAITGWTSSGAVVTGVCTFGAGVGTGPLTEAGIFNASSGGTMLCRTVFSVINKGALDSMTVTWTITLS